jgi:hypothetical protein
MRWGQKIEVRGQKTDDGIRKCECGRWNLSILDFRIFKPCAESIARRVKAKDSVQRFNRRYTLKTALTYT